MRKLQYLTLSLLAAFLMSAQAQTIQLNFLAWYGEDQAKVFNQALAEYQKLNPNVKINISYVAGTGAATYPNVLRTSIAGGRAPDMFTMWGGSIAGPFIDSQSAIDTAPYFKKYGWDKLLIPAAVNIIKRNGTTWGVPIDLRAMTLYYRKDIFAKNGLKVPTTFAQLEEVCAKLKTQNIPCVSTAGTYGWHAMRMFQFFLEHTAGPTLHDQLLQGKASWDRPEVVAAFALFKKWTDNGWFPNGFMGISPDQAQQLFLQGKAAMILEGDWFVTNVAGAGLNGDTVGFFPTPTDQKPLRLSGFGEQFMISKQSKNPDAVAEFINWWVQPATQKKYYAVNGSTATKGGVPSENANPLAVQYADMVANSNTFTVLDQAFPPEFMSTTYFRLQSEVASGKTSPADAAKQMQAGLAQVK